MVDINFSNMTYAETPIEDTWKIPVLCELIEMREGRVESNLSKQEILDMINAIST